jgi:Fic family protein
MVEAANDQWRGAVHVVGAILAHLYLAWIHPFGDGNGRTARLVEFQLLAAAGFPTPACHLLSNYYNRTRQLYYRMLRETSRVKPYPVGQFVSYALQGLAEELREQLKAVQAQQIGDAWVNFVHGFELGSSAETARRRRLLALSLEPGELTPISRIRKLTPDLAVLYATKQQKTITRDINELETQGLIFRRGDRITPAVERLTAFLPLRRLD